MPSRVATVLGQMRRLIGLASLGNVLRHEYQRVDPVLLWTLLNEELEPLGGALERMEAMA
jgi:uncharacterized protein with HEPN domain